MKSLLWERKEKPKLTFLAKMTKRKRNKIRIIKIRNETRDKYMLSIVTQQVNIPTNTIN